MDKTVDFSFPILFDVVEFKCFFKYSYCDDYSDERRFVYDCRMYIDGYYKSTFTICAWSYDDLRFQLLELIK